MIKFGLEDISHGASEANCMSCRKYLSCKDESKAFGYVCESYKRYKLTDAVKQTLEATNTEIEIPQVVSAVSDPMFSNFNIRKTILGAIKNSPLVASDIKIDDSSFPEAPNFFVFATSEKFLNVKPYLEQAIIATIVLAEYCPRCTDTEWLLETHKVTDSLGKFKRKVALLEHGKCPHCKSTRSKLVTKYDLNNYAEMAACLGQRSGKSALVAMMFAYITHRFIKLQNPNEVYGLMRSNVLHCTFVAVTFKQAKDNLWDPYYGNILGSPWFTEYHLMLENSGRHHGEDLFKLKDTFIQYNHRRILFYPTGPDKRVLRGRTRLGASIDELGWFDNNAGSNAVKINANEIYTALGNSLTTVNGKAHKLFERGFYNIPPAYFLNISSPSSQRDKIMELVRIAQGSRKLYGVLKPTWEVNPDISRESLSEEFRKNEVVAMRDFGVQPPLASSPFIGHLETVAQCATGKSNPVKYHYCKNKSKSGRTTRYAKIDKIVESGEPSILAIDAGYSNNSFACCFAHLKDHRYPIIDGFVEVQSLPGAPINFTLVYKHILLPIIKARNILLVAADRWNSLKIMSDIEEETEAATRIYSLKYVDMQLFKDHLQDKQATLPRTVSPPESIMEYQYSEYPQCFKAAPVDHFVLQCLTVQDTGSQVIKGDQLTDDLLRAAMLATTLLMDEDYAEVFDKSRMKAIKPPVPVSEMAVFRGGSGGGSNSTIGGAGAGQTNPIGFMRSTGTA